MAREKNEYHGRSRAMPTPSGWTPKVQKAAQPEMAADPHGVLERFYAKKREEKAAEKAAELALLEKKRKVYAETGQVLAEPMPELSLKGESSGKGGRQSKPGTLWVMNVSGEVRVQEYESTGAATQAAEVSANLPTVVWARAFNENIGKVFIGAGWVHAPAPGEKVKNMPLEWWLQLTPPEKHKVKEAELGKYVKPGWVCKDMSQKNPRWQTCKNSRRGSTYDRRNRSQGINYSDTR